jgi:hypothetical protein
MRKARSGDAVLQGSVEHARVGVARARVWRDAQEVEEVGVLQRVDAQLLGLAVLAPLVIRRIQPVAVEPVR